MGKEHVADLIQELARRIGIDAFHNVCLNLMAGADCNQYLEELRSLTGHAWKPGDILFDHSSWPDYWLRSWGARGLLHVLDDPATDAVVAGLGDEHCRPAEMCLKIVARHEVEGAADGAAQLLNHPLPRVRIQALRALALVGDTDHLGLAVAAMEDDHPGVCRQAYRTIEAMRLRLDALQL